jgi:hypothetical protein
MSQYFNSPAQAEIINSPQTLANIGCDDGRTALHTIALRMMYQIWKGESCLAVMPSPEDREALLSILQEMGLGELTIHIRPAMPVTAEDGRELSDRISRLKKQPQEVDMLPIHQYNAHADGILSTYRARYFSSDQQANWRQKLDEYLGLSPDERVEKLLSDLSGMYFEGSSEELNNLRDFISDASRLYRRDFELYRNFTLLPSGIRHSDALNNRLDEVSHALFVLHEAAESLRDRYLSHLRWLRFSYADDITGRTMGLENRLHLLHADLMEFYNGPNQSGRRNTMAVSRLLHEFHNLFNELSSQGIAPRQHFKDVSRDMIPVVENALRAIPDRYQEITSQVAVRLKSVNRHNTQDPVLEDLEADLLSLAQRINDTQLFENVFEVNTLSFRKQVDVVISMVKKLENAHLELQKELPYYQWLEFLQTSDLRLVAVLKSLLSFDPSEWSIVFEAWYASEWLTRQINIKYAGLSSSASLQILCSFYNDYCRCNCSQGVSAAANRADTLLHSTKTSVPDVYEMVFKNSKAVRPVKWRAWLESCGGAFSGVYPILIVDDDQELQWTDKSPYRNLVYYRHEHPNIEWLQLFSTIYSWYSSKESGMDYYLRPQLNHVVVSSAEVGRSQKVALARTQAEALFAMGRQPEIFGMKHGRIISFASGLINEWLQEQLYDAGLKRLTDAEEGIDILTAALLDRSENIFLITEDDVFNPEDPQTLIWQHHLLDCIRNVGFVHINIDTVLLFRTNGQSFRAVINHIRRHHTFSGKHINKQLRFAFD